MRCFAGWATGESKVMGEGGLRRTLGELCGLLCRLGPLVKVIGGEAHQGNLGGNRVGCFVPQQLQLMGANELILWAAVWAGSFAHRAGGPWGNLRETLGEA